MGVFSVKAVLSAVDKNFSSTMKSALGYTNNLKDTLTSGIGFGILTGVGQKAFASLSGGVSGIISDMGDASAAWKTFEGNMTMNGTVASEIQDIKKELQDFATQTVYSASDMASTYAQLAAVGTKDTRKLVKGFGGLAAAAENPTQAMKTLSQQATQMAAKPTVAWEDFKLMLEQTPAGVAAVAKTMGMSTTEMIKNIQDGTIATEDFFNAVAETGTNANFTKLATEYKTVGQAMDGLTETMSTKLQPAFDTLSGYGIKAVSKLSDSFDQIDGNALAAKITSGVDTVMKYVDVLKTNMSGVGKAFHDAFSAIGSEFSDISGKFGSDTSIKNFGDAVHVAAGYLKKFAGFLEENSDKVALVLKNLPKLLVAYKGFKILKAVAPFVGVFSKGILMLAGKGVGAIAGKLFGIGKAQKTVGEASESSAKQMVQSAGAFLMLGAGIALIAGGFALLAYSSVQLANAGPLAIGVMVGMVAAVAGLLVVAKAVAPALTAGAAGFVAFGGAIILAAVGMALMTAAAISLANAGPLAIGVMVGMVAAIALLAAGAALLGPALSAGAIGFIAFGAAIALVGVGALLAAVALTLVASVLPTVVEYGAQGALSIAALGAGMIVFAAGAAAAGVGCIVLGVGLAIVAVGLGLIAVTVLVVAAGVLALAAGAVILGSGLIITGAALMLVGASLPMVATGALLSLAGFTALLAVSVALTAVLTLLTVPLLLLGVSFTAASLGIVAFGLAMTTSALGVAAMSLALKAVNSSMKSIAKNAKAAQSSITSMKKSVSIVNDGLDALGSKAKSAIDKLVSAFSGSTGDAQSAASSLANGFKNGIQTGIAPIPSIGISCMAKFNSGLMAGGVMAIATSRSISSSIISTMNATQSGMYNCGYYIGIGLANGMRASLGEVQAVAAQLAAAAEEAVRAKAKIHSPSRVFEKLGEFVGEGFAAGIDSMNKRVKKASDDMVSIPDINAGHDIENYKSGMSSKSTLNDEYTYTPVIYVSAEVTSVMDGKEVGYGSARYVQEKNAKEEKVKRYINGVR